MDFNTLKPAPGSRPKKKVVGRGIGSGSGKTCGRGHKGQKSRSGATRNFAGFEGGQMPLQKRLPKSGFTSRKSAFRVELTLSEVSKVSGDVVDMKTLLEAKQIFPLTKQVKIILSGKVDRALTVSGVSVTKGAKAAIESAGGQIKESD